MQTPSTLPPVTARTDTPLISCVVPAYNEAANLQMLVPQLSAALAALSPRHEIIIVDDGSSDDTAITAVALMQQYPVKCLLLSRNFGKENALTAGLHEAGGDVVVLMDSDLQHPVAMIPVFFAK